MVSSDRKTAIVTGAGSGIGLFTARKLLSKGVNVVAIGRRQSPLRELAEEASNADVEVLPMDVTVDEAPKAAVQTAISRFGRLDYLVNNAGIGKPLPVDETTDDILDLYLSIHLRAPFRFCREALLFMPSGSAIVNVSSTFALIGGLRGGAYSAAKAGIVGLTQHLAAHYGDRGVRSNVVAPGAIETPMTEYAWETQRFRRMNFDMTPLDRTGTAADVASAIVFLLSEDACFINGAVLPVDGGWSSTKYLSPEAIEALPADRPS
jgi:NAD(P)-dependent dehydrogenase (short-subunit alcohol dehydrogenase family)